MNTKALIVFSGGQDSTTCLYWALEQGYAVHALTFDYGQRHRIELEAAQAVLEAAGIDASCTERCDVRGILRSTSPLMTDAALREFTSPEELPQSGVQNTFVPMRNQFFLTIAANRAYALNCTHLITGVSQADYGGYPDCREEFIKAFEHCCNLGCFTGEPGVLNPLKVLTPLMHLSKAQTVKLAYRLPGCLKGLAWSHTAYDGSFPPDGRDHASVLRAKGFSEADLPDPLVLRAWKAGLMTLPESPNYRQERLNYALKLLESQQWLAR